MAAVGGLAAGFVTTVAGIGGGIALVAFLSVFAEPKEVVGLTAPVLMIGNFTRVYLFRDEIDVETSRWFLAGTVPAALAASIALPNLSAGLIRSAMGAFLLLFVAWQLIVAPRQSPSGTPIAAWIGLPAGALLGALSATVGGGGPAGAPYLHARGLRRGRFAATSSLCNGASHLIKTVVFLTTGLLTLSNLPASAAAAVTVTVGNRLGKTVLGTISESTFANLLLIALTVAAIRLVTS